jgi:hypothetical protein
MNDRDMREADKLNPDGWETKPTDADYKAFKDAMIEKFGIDGWKAYNRIVK